MYEEYWGLSKKPFENTPDPNFLYYSKQHEEVLARLIYAVKERKGAAMLTGIFGCGKTLLGQALLSELTEDRYKIAFIRNPQMSYEELLMYIATHLGARELPTQKSEIMINVLLDAIEAILNNNVRDGKDSIVILDEMHIVNDNRIFEGLRLLLNFQTEDRFLLTLLLFGQPELKERVDNNKQLEQRIAIKSHLDSLSHEDTKLYIIHRLTVAGRAEPIFTTEALDVIFDRTGGIPRRINRLCDVCLLSGFARNLQAIDKDTVFEEARSLSG
ncbi:MAG: hypothetical protein AMJ78_03425 [Omnitrophica WOR_2 bacterium SM23_29]|nr:MAG: hypothetical protein AMJ78_03425 [Omnitrophica WOR_2 bacterium SM23_29]